MMQQTRDILVGAAVLIAGGGFMVYAFTGGGLSGPQGYPILAGFGQVDGLAVGSEVRISGVPVGEVTNLTIEPKTLKAMVTMMIDEDVRLPLDTGALIVQNGLLGSKFIKLDPGGEEEYLAPGEELEFLQDSVIIIELLKKVVDDVESKRKPKEEGNAGSADKG